MIKTIFGELVFNTGWKTQMQIELFNNSFSITVKAKAYYEKDGITDEQKEAFSDFNENENQRLKSVEKLLCKFSGNNASTRFTPRMLLFERCGSYAILFDDKEDDDGGVAVCLTGKQRVVSQDEYL